MAKLTKGKPKVGTEKAYIKRKRGNHAAPRRTASGREGGIMLALKRALKHIEEAQADMEAAMENSGAVAWLSAWEINNKLYGAINNLDALIKAIEADKEGK